MLNIQHVLFSIPILAAAQIAVYKIQKTEIWGKIEQFIKMTPLQDQSVCLCRNIHISTRPDLHIKDSNNNLIRCKEMYFSCLMTASSLLLILSAGLIWQLLCSLSRFFSLSPPPFTSHPRTESE